jgi:hypothetical protein
MKHRYSPSRRILPDWMMAKQTAKTLTKTPTKTQVEGNLAERITLKIKIRGYDCERLLFGKKRPDVSKNLDCHDEVGRIAP